MYYNSHRITFYFSCYGICFKIRFETASSSTPFSMFWFDLPTQTYYSHMNPMNRPKPKEIWMSPSPRPKLGSAHCSWAQYTNAPRTYGAQGVSLPYSAIHRYSGNALRNHTAEQFSKANISSNGFNPISNGAYSLSGIINLGPSHTSGIRGQWWSPHYPKAINKK